MRQEDFCAALSFESLRRSSIDRLVFRPSSVSWVYKVTIVEALKWWLSPGEEPERETGYINCRSDDEDEPRNTQMDGCRAGCLGQAGTR